MAKIPRKRKRCKETLPESSIVKEKCSQLKVDEVRHFQCVKEVKIQIERSSYIENLLLQNFGLKQNVESTKILQRNEFQDNVNEIKCLEIVSQNISLDNCDKPQGKNMSNKRQLMYQIPEKHKSSHSFEDSAETMSNKMSPKPVNIQITVGGGVKFAKFIECDTLSNNNVLHPIPPCEVKKAAIKKIWKRKSEALNDVRITTFSNIFSSAILGTEPSCLNEIESVPKKLKSSFEPRNIAEIQKHINLNRSFQKINCKNHLIESSSYVSESGESIPSGTTTPTESWDSFSNSTFSIPSTSFINSETLHNSSHIRPVETNNIVQNMNRIQNTSPTSIKTRLTLTPIVVPEVNQPTVIRLVESPKETQNYVGISKQTPTKQIRKRIVFTPPLEDVQVSQNHHCEKSYNKVHTQELMFKRPTLPLSKRPPTRMKQYSPIKPVHDVVTFEEDDAISLFAESEIFESNGFGSVSVPCDQAAVFVATHRTYDRLVESNKLINYLGEKEEEIQQDVGHQQEANMTMLRQYFEGTQPNCTQYTPQTNQDIGNMNSPHKSPAEVNYVQPTHKINELMGQPPSHGWTCYHHKSPMEVKGLVVGTPPPVHTVLPGLSTRTHCEQAITNNESVAGARNNCYKLKSPVEDTLLGTHINSGFTQTNRVHSSKNTECLSSTDTNYYQLESFQKETVVRVPTHLAFSKPNFVQATPKVKEWVATTSTNYCQYNVERDLRRVCYNFVNNGVCRRRICKYFHKVPDFFNNLNNLSEKQFQTVLNFSNSHKHIFKLVFNLLLNYMSEKMRQDMVLHLVREIMKIDCDKMPFVNEVITALKNMGFTFDQAITEILLTNGKENECLLDILLSFAVDEVDVVETNWSVIRNLTSFRKNNLDSGVIEDIFRKCIECDPSNQTLCENIYKDLIIMNNIELGNIRKDILIKYIALLLKFNLSSFAVYTMKRSEVSEEEIKVYVGDLFQEADNSSDPIPESSSSETSFSAASQSQITSTPVDEITKGSASKNGSDSNYAEGDIFSPIMPDFLQAFCEQNSPNITPQKKISNRNNATSFINNIKFGSIAGTGTGSSSSENFRYESKKEATVPRNSYADPFGDSSHAPTSTSSSAEERTSAKGSYEVSDDDIVAIVEAIKTQNILIVFSLIKKYAHPEKTAKTLVGQIIVAIKSIKDMDFSCEVIMKIFKISGDKYLFRNDENMVSTLRLLGLNLLPLLDLNGRHQTACDVIDIFGKDLPAFASAESLYKSEIFSTKELKYIMIFKAFFKNNRIKDALRLLKFQESKLFETFFPSKLGHSSQYKEQIINAFFEATLKTNLAHAKDLITFVMLNLRFEPSDEFVNYLNKVMVAMLNQCSTYKIDLKDLFTYIVNGWYKYIRKSVLRAFLIELFHDLHDRKILEFFNLCIDIEIYSTHEGTENSISIPSNLLKEEIYLLLHYHFFKIVSSNFPISNLVIKVDSPILNDEFNHALTVLINSETQFELTVRRILNVLARMPNFPLVDRVEVNDKYIILAYEEIKQFLHPYSLGNLPELHKFR